MFARWYAVKIQRPEMVRDIKSLGTAALRDGIGTIEPSCKNLQRKKLMPKKQHNTFFMTVLSYLKRNNTIGKNCDYAYQNLSDNFYLFTSDACCLWY